MAKTDNNMGDFQQISVAELEIMIDALESYGLKGSMDTFISDTRQAFLDQIGSETDGELTDLEKLARKQLREQEEDERLRLKKEFKQKVDFVRAKLVFMLEAQRRAEAKLIN